MHFHDKYYIYQINLKCGGVSNMKIAIYGAGSLGTILGAYISKAGLDVDLITRNKPHVEAMNQNGAHVTGMVDMVVPVRAMIPEQMTEEYDVIFLMTKQLDNEKVLNNLKRFMSNECVICTTQNGLPELSVAKVVGEDKTIGCTVGWGATFKGKGESELTSEVKNLNFYLGRMNGEVDKKLLEVKKILECMCSVHIEKNFMGMRWAKLMINAAFSGMSAVTGGTFGEAVEDLQSRRCCQEILKECIDVAHAANIKIEKIEGKDAAKIFYYKKKGLWQKITFYLLPFTIKKHRLLKASMLQDLEKGKKCEVDAINGVVCEFGRKYGVATPFNDKVCEIIHGIEEGKYRYRFDNVKIFYC